MPAGQRSGVLLSGDAQSESPSRMLPNADEDNGAHVTGAARDAHSDAAGSGVAEQGEGRGKGVDVP
jgi:hypothetical protein